MKYISLIVLFATICANAQPDTPQTETTQQEPQTVQSKIKNTIDEYTDYFKQELVDTYHGLGELGSDFLTDVLYVTEPVSSVIATGATELGLLAKDGYETLKIELRPLGRLITAARKKLEAAASHIRVDNT